MIYWSSINTQYIGNFKEGERENRWKLCNIWATIVTSTINHSYSERYPLFIVGFPLPMVCHINSGVLYFVIFHPFWILFVFTWQKGIPWPSFAQAWSYDPIHVDPYINRLELSVGNKGHTYQFNAWWLPELRATLLIPSLLLLRIVIWSISGQGWCTRYEEPHMSRTLWISSLQEEVACLHAVHEAP